MFKTILKLIAFLLVFAAAAKAILIFLEYLGATPEKKYITIFDDDDESDY